MQRKRLSWCVILLLAGALQSQTSDPVVPVRPLPGISGRELELFRLGLEDFNEVETPDDGLGPAFNGTSCSQCHAVPAIGGIAAMSEVRAGFIGENGKFVVLQGETLFPLFSTGKHSCQVQIPAEANVIARRVPIPVFGAGLVEAIPDETILALEDPADVNGDGIRGRAARILDVATGRRRVGRFGWKAQQATLLAFSADAYRNEMGITNDLFRNELTPGIDPEKAKLCDPRSEPEDVRDRATGLRGIDNFENFMKLLAPLERGPLGSAEVLGEGLFTAVGCAGCHVPQLTAGASQDPLFDRKPVHLFSDLLLHDIGTGDGIEQADALGAEIRTPALWGLRFRRPLLHDGRAATPRAAIGHHDGESAGSRRLFDALPPSDQQALLAFLNSL